MSDLGEFLQARRGRVRPADVGLTAYGPRRVPGLRRDELAALAGVSVQYLTRLEQGVDRHPSAQVLDALAAALQLDRDATAHLHALATPPSTANTWLKAAVGPRAAAGPGATAGSGAGTQSAAAARPGGTGSAAPTGAASGAGDATGPATVGQPAAADRASAGDRSGAGAQLGAGGFLEPAPRARGAGGPESASGDVRRLLDAWSGIPAYVRNGRFDVVAANKLAMALAPLYQPGRNLVRDMFLDPAVRVVFPDWPEIAAQTVAALRASTDSRNAELAASLNGSDEFRRLWALHDVRPARDETKRFLHPYAGMLVLRRQSLAVAGSDLVIIAYQPEPGSPSADSLADLA
ncbi:helix-turn-helix transcriptional regulator [Actinoplanes bogorensis]|uniref:Helix-turn-helix transcriptional regulator n=1 Tax=Paractinoplanes bogorensis TaxID=1610840 RepID=A0ABS5YN12_9ACTN|nr:helix-turn-helix transcriptional regulator [Actinoplanes bogorensis]MBU2664854.1 helix-turn-helix transcriptional regulator [Actinoplanes bogorensis]